MSELLEDHPVIKKLMESFDFEPLPVEVQEVIAPFAKAAVDAVETAQKEGDSPQELSRELAPIVEAKDMAVRKATL